MRLYTEADFSRKSREAITFDPENPDEVKAHIDYLKYYHENLKSTLGEYKRDRIMDKVMHIKHPYKKSGDFEKLTSRYKNQITFELNRIGKEVDRLHKLI